MQFMGMSAGVITATGEGGGRFTLLLYGDDVIIRGCCVGGVIHRILALHIPLYSSYIYSARRSLVRRE